MECAFIVLGQRRILCTFIKGTLSQGCPFGSMGHIRNVPGVPLWMGGREKQ